MATRDHRSYAQFYVNYEENVREPKQYKNPDEKALKEGRVRRRIEDVLDGLRLDRELFNEWSQ